MKNGDIVSDCMDISGGEQISYVNLYENGKVTELVFEIKQSKLCPEGYTDLS